MEPEHGDEFTKLATEIVVAISDFAQQSVAMALRGDRATEEDQAEYNKSGTVLRDAITNALRAAKNNRG